MRRRGHRGADDYGRPTVRDRSRIGGDGTFLRAAEYARPAGVPLLGVNFGHVGFLARRPEAVAADDQGSHRRPLRVEDADASTSRCRITALSRDVGALNEGRWEKSKRERVLEVALRRRASLLRFGCDGVLCATPTGSTAYAYSGRPDRVANVDALLSSMRPLRFRSAGHRVSAVGHRRRVAARGPPRVLACDGRRLVDTAPGQNWRPVLIAHVFGPGIAEDREGPVGAPRAWALRNPPRSARPSKSTTARPRPRTLAIWEPSWASLSCAAAFAVVTRFIRCMLDECWVEG